MTATYEIKITVTVDNEGTHMGIHSDFDEIRTIEALKKMIDLLNEHQVPNVMPS